MLNEQGYIKLTIYIRNLRLDAAWPPDEGAKGEMQRFVAKNPTWRSEYYVLAARFDTELLEFDVFLHAGSHLEFYTMNASYVGRNSIVTIWEQPPRIAGTEFVVPRISYLLLSVMVTLEYET
jgi:hypothetical protein